MRIESASSTIAVAQRRLHPVVDVGDQLVAQVVEAGLADRDVGDVAGVRLAPLLAGGRLGDPADGQPEQVVDRRHPVGVAAGQVVVDGDHVHRAVAQPDVPVRGDRRGQRLALTGGHLGDVCRTACAIAPSSCTSYGRSSERPPGGLAADGADLDQILGLAGQPRSAPRRRARAAPRSRASISGSSSSYRRRPTTVPGRSRNRRALFFRRCAKLTAPNVPDFLPSLRSGGAQDADAGGELVGLGAS